jgi:hypothetical protein
MTKRDTDEQRLRDYIRKANGLVWDAYRLIADQAVFNSAMIDKEQGEKTPGKRTLKLIVFSKTLNLLNGEFCKQFKEEIYECGCEKCLADKKV